MERALCGGAGAVDGDLQAVELFVREVFRRRDFQISATAEAPGGVDDFAGEGLFERSCGREFGEVAGFELIKDVALCGTDEVGDGKETKFRCILRDTGAALGRGRAEGQFGILPIGQDLSGGSHGSVIVGSGSGAD